MKLKELTESKMSDMHQDMQEKLMRKFSLGDHDASDVLDFALGESEWEDLSDDVRETLYSHYEKTMPYGTAKARSGDPYEFIGKALKTDLGLK
jgi:hypothetical protein